MQLTSIVQIVKKPSQWYRVWGYWRSPAILKMEGLWSDRQDQRLRTFLMRQRGKGKSRSENIYEKLSKPKYNIKWVKEKPEETSITK